MRLITIITIIFITNSSIGQIGTSIPSSRIADWTISGYQGEIPEDADYDVIIDITQAPYFADNTGSIDVSTIVQTAIDMADENLLTMIFFPPGTYKFKTEIKLKTDIGGTGANNDNNIVIKGSGQYHTNFIYQDLERNCILIEGSENPLKTHVSAGHIRGSTYLLLDSEYTGLEADDFIQIYQDSDPAPCAGQGNAPDPIGQIVQIESVSGTYITLHEALSYNYLASKNVRIQKIHPVTNVGIENIKISFINLIGYNKIDVNYAANCWIRGVESDFSVHSYSHFLINYSTHIEISGCYIHNGNNASENYGISLGSFFTSNCLVENNVLTNLRHGIVASSSPMKNVVSYNFANNSKIENGSSTSDIMLHGYYPTEILFEGNVTQELHSDVFHGKQGDFNTFFRNTRPKNAAAELNIWATGWPNIVGNNAVNEIVLTSVCYDSWNELILCNTPMITCESLPDCSYYLFGRPEFLSDQFYTWPPIGPKTPGSVISTNSNPAEYRYASGGQQCDYKRSSLVGYSVKNTGLFTAINSVSSTEGKLVKNQNEYSIGRNSLYSEWSPLEKIDHITTIRLSTGLEEIIYVINNPLGGTAVYITTNKEITPGTSPVYTNTSGTITSITSGDFSGSGVDEIVTGFIDANGFPHIYRTNNEYDLTQNTIYYNPSVYWRVDELTTGDFDNNGDDELIIGFNAAGSASSIYHSETGTNVGTKIWEDLTGYWQIAGLAAGDFNEDGMDELIEGFNSTAGPSIYKIMNGKDSPPISIYSNSSYWTIGALAAGDFDGDGDDELVTAFNSASEGPNIYKSELAINCDDVLIYDSQNVYWEVNALAIEKCHGNYDQFGVCNPSIYNGNGGNYSPIQDTTFELITKNHEVNPENISVFPNPSSNFFTVELESQPEDPIQIVIYDQIGNIVLKTIIQERITKLDLSDKPAGIYFLKILVNNEFSIKKLVHL